MVFADLVHTSRRELMEEGLEAEIRVAPHRQKAGPLYQTAGNTRPGWSLWPLIKPGIPSTT